MTAAVHNRDHKSEQSHAPSGVELLNDPVLDMRQESDSLGAVEVPADKLWGAQTQRSLEHFSIGADLIPREMITAYATLKKAAAAANNAGKRLDDRRHDLIVQACDEILAGEHGARPRFTPTITSTWLNRRTILFHRPCMSRPRS